MLLDEPHGFDFASYRPFITSLHDGPVVERPDIGSGGQLRNVIGIRQTCEFALAEIPTANLRRGVNVGWRQRPRWQQYWEKFRHNVEFSLRSELN